MSNDIPITLSAVMQDIMDDKPVDIQKGLIHHSEGVDLLPSNIELSWHGNISLISISLLIAC